MLAQRAISAGRLSPSPGSSRRYATPRRDQRAAATRASILSAAETLFLRDGYARTSMKAIATAAGVSEKTMYLAFSTKATLLRQVIQVAVQGDEAATPLSEREEWRALVRGPVGEVFERFAAMNARLMTRTAAIIALGESAAAADPELAEYRNRAHAATRANLRALAAELECRGALAPDVGVQQAADTIFAVASDESVFLRLTRECDLDPRPLCRPHRRHPRRDTRQEVRGLTVCPRGYVCTIDSGGRSLVIGSAWRWTIFQPSSSRRKTFVTRRTLGAAFVGATDLHRASFDLQLVGKIGRRVRCEALDAKGLAVAE